MSNEELILLAEKVENGTADKQELLLYAFICETFQKQGLDTAVPEEELLEMEEAALARLSAAEREVVALRGLLELDGPTVARALGISTTACSTRLSRALKRLEEMMRDARD